MTQSDSFPQIAGPPRTEEGASALAKAVGKTVGSVEFGVQHSGTQGDEAIILHFTDETSLAIVARPPSAAGVDETALALVWRGEEEREAYDDSLAM